MTGGSRQGSRIDGLLKCCYLNIDFGPARHAGQYRGIVWLPRGALGAQYPELEPGGVRKRALGGIGEFGGLGGLLNAVMRLWCLSRCVFVFVVVFMNAVGNVEKKKVG